MRGFTLIEAIIYIALLGLIMSGAVVVSYQLLTNSQGLDVKNAAGEEGNFTLRKLDWALSNVAVINVPSAGGWGNSLSLIRYDGTSVDMRLVSGAIQMRENSGSYASTTTSNVKISSLSFHHIPASGTGPEGLEASTTINGLTFSIQRYFRK